MWRPPIACVTSFYSFLQFAFLRIELEQIFLSWLTSTSVAQWTMDIQFFINEFFHELLQLSKVGDVMIHWEISRNIHFHKWLHFCEWEIFSKETFYAQQTGSIVVGKFKLIKGQWSEKFVYLSSTTWEHFLSCWRIFVFKELQNVERAPVISRSLESSHLRQEKQSENFDLKISVTATIRKIYWKLKSENVD